eukprot:RCo016302
MRASRVARLGPQAQQLVQKGLSLATPEWSEEELASYAFQKDFSTLLRAAYSEAEVRQYRTEHDIKVYQRPQGPAPDGSQQPEETKPFSPAMQFSDVLLPPQISSILQNTFARPLPIQAQTWPILLSGRDCIGLAETGSGKTIAFTIPAMVHWLAQPRPKPDEGPVVLTLAPTRELVIQLAEEMGKFRDLRTLRVRMVYGGTEGRASRTVQAGLLSMGVDFLVATPGRLIDLVEAKIVPLHRVTFFVLDEADIMLTMGLAGQICAIVAQLRPDRQTVMFSATWLTEVRALAGRLLNNPVKVVVHQAEGTVANKDVEQKFLLVHSKKDRNMELLRLLRWVKTRNPNCTRTLVFVNSRDAVLEVVKVLLPTCESVQALHGLIPQKDREAALERLRETKDAVMVATDVAGRGLDIKDLACVVNYNLPDSIDRYVHRIGRTGRAGKAGLAVRFFHPTDRKSVG